MGNVIQNCDCVKVIDTTSGTYNNFNYYRLVCLVICKNFNRIIRVKCTEEQFNYFNTQKGNEIDIKDNIQFVMTKDSFTPIYVE